MGLNVILQGYIIVPDEDMDRVLKALPKHIELTRKESGCIVFNVEQDEDNKHRFNVYEEFESTESFELHQLRVRSSYWGEITQNVERHYTVEAISTKELRQ
ncbi:antibiotic biosynthesis monooxygenase [Gammaproteobacteria bacterium 45_16_T64]|nr:antibiotic biosynthesis monooxygenase [Gammaproteobacteria bacterium 45_16_T64]